MRRYPKVTAAAAGALIVATLAQLAVPQLVQRIIDIIVEGVGYQTVLNLPPVIQQVRRSLHPPLGHPAHQPLPVQALYPSLDECA